MTISNFPRRARLKKTDDFRNVFLTGRKIRVGPLVLCVRKRAAPAKENRLGIVASKRAVRKAVKRNRLKRLVREFFRKRQEDMRPASDIVVRFLKGVEELDEKEIVKMLGTLFERAGLGGKKSYEDSGPC